MGVFGCVLASKISMASLSPHMIVPSCLVYLCYKSGYLRSCLAGRLVLVQSSHLCWGDFSSGAASAFGSEALSAAGWERGARGGVEVTRYR